MYIFLDFETISSLDLKEVGQENYLTAPGADVVCYCIMAQGAPTLTGKQNTSNFAKHGVLLRKELAQGVKIAAWNARFERRVWQTIMTPRYGWPEVTEENFIDMAGVSAYNAGPLGLDQAATFWGCKFQKMTEGRAMIALLKKQGKLGKPFPEHALPTLIEYCVQDTRILKWLAEVMPPIPDSELAQMALNERLNDRGIYLDREMLNAIPPILEDLTVGANAEITKVTNGEITAVTQVQRMRPWVEKKLDIKLDSLDKAAIDELLDSGVPGATKKVLQLRRAYGTTAATKFRKAANHMTPDGRVHGLIIYAGASATARFSSRTIQMHNLVRDKPAIKPEKLRNLICKGTDAMQLFFSPEEIPTQLARMTRSMIVAPPGKKLVVADFTSIEAMYMPWLAEYIGIKVGPYMEAWRDPSRDAYREQTAQLLGIPVQDVDDNERQLGKVQTLACQFSGGKGAMLQMGRAYGYDFSETEADNMVKDWRMANGWAVLFWDAIDSAFQAAVKSYDPRKFGVWPIGPKYNEEMPYNMSDTLQVIKVPYAHHDGPRLVLTTPAGGRLTYHDVGIRLVRDRDGAMKSQPTYAKGNQVGKSKRVYGKLYRAITVENIVQRGARDILCDVLARCDAAGYSPVVHVHDEPVLEVDEADAEDAKKFLVHAMETPPDWAAGLPSRGDAHIVDRYQKL